MGDLTEIHRLLDIELRDADLRTDKMETLTERAEWLQWTVLNYRQLAQLYQPPYGDRAVLLKSSGQFIGACGFVPCLNAFEQLPGLASSEISQGSGFYTTEFGLFYAISPAHQRQWYATEAAQAMIHYALGHLRLKQVIATTTYDNPASMGVMRKLGMRIEKKFPPRTALAASRWYP
jgi:RimJ/RimL family protein N-acetyltransferase